MIVRTEKNKDYSVIANVALLDNRLSLKAKGLWAFCMTKPDEWSITYRGLSSQLKEGQGAILAAMKELEEYGYLTRGKVREKDGTFTQDSCTVHEKPCVDFSRVDSSRTKVNTDKVNTNTYSEVGDETEAGSEPQALKPSKVAQEADLLRVLNTETGRNFRVLPREATKTLKLFTLEEITNALRRMKAHPWHSARWKELNPAYMLRSTTIDQFVTGSTEREIGWD